MLILTLIVCGLVSVCMLVLAWDARMSAAVIVDLRAEILALQAAIAKAVDASVAKQPNGVPGPAPPKPVDLTPLFDLVKAECAALRATVLTQSDRGQVERNGLSAALVELTKTLDAHHRENRVAFEATANTVGHLHADLSDQLREAAANRESYSGEVLRAIERHDDASRELHGQTAQAVSRQHITVGEGAQVHMNPHGPVGVHVAVKKER